MDNKCAHRVDGVCMTIWVLMLLGLECVEDTTLELPISAMSIPQRVINLSLTAFASTLLQLNNAYVPHVTSLRPLPLPWRRYIAVSTSLIIMVFIGQTHLVRTHTHSGRDGVAREVQQYVIPGSRPSWLQTTMGIHPVSQSAKPGDGWKQGFTRTHPSLDSIRATDYGYPKSQEAPGPTVTSLIMHPPTKHNMSYFNFMYTYFL